MSLRSIGTRLPVAGVWITMGWTVGLVIGTLALVSCSPARIGMTTAAAREQRPAAASSLPTLQLDPGTHAALELGNSGSGTVHTGGSFAATGPYMIYATCEGHGTLTVHYGSQGASSFTCTSSPLIFGTPQQDASRGQDVHVTATTNGSITWHAVVESQD